MTEHFRPIGRRITVLRIDLLYDESFLPPDLADRYFAELRDTGVWEQNSDLPETVLDSA
jgi:hypothetical protein